MIGDRFARREDIIQDAVPLWLFAIQGLHFVLVGADLRYPALDVAHMGVPSPYQLGVPHRGGTGLAHCDDTADLCTMVMIAASTAHVGFPRPSHNLAVLVQTAIAMTVRSVRVK